MIRSSKTSLKFANKNKLETVHLIIDEYKNVLSQFVGLLWDMENIPTLVPIEVTSKVDTWLSARMKQCVSKQASGIVRGTKQKQKQRLFIIKKLIKEGQFKKARKLQRLYDEISISKPILTNVEMELDSRFVKIELDKTNSFDGWLIISSIGNRIKLEIPFKRTAHINKLLGNGKLKSGIRLSKSNITLMVECEQPSNDSIAVVGIDIGVNSLLSVDTGTDKFQSQKDIHGHDLSSINDKLSRCKKGSKGFQRASEHRTNYINHSINQLNWNDMKTLRIEKIRGLRHGKRTSRKLQHFIYKPIFDRLKLKSEEHNVCVEEINPTYTSQRCSVCGWTRKSNRRGKRFKCEKCSHEQDADLNASTNIRLNLREIGEKERLSHKNKTGFYWNEMSHELIVRDVQRTEDISI